MSKPSLLKDEFSEEKHKLLYWVARLSDEEPQKELLDNVNFDIPQLSALLQCIGFNLNAFEKIDSGQIPIVKSFDVEEKKMTTVQLICSSSGMKSTLIQKLASCKCPNESAVDEGQFWHVSGFGSQSSINASTSSLLPTISPAKTKLIKILLAKIHALISSTDEEKVDISVISDSPKLTRHHSFSTVLEAIEAKDTSLIKGLKRRSSFEVSPPRDSSSPIPNLCTNLSKVSLGSAQNSSVVKNLESIKKLAEDSLDLIGANNATFTKKKRISDIKPATPPATITPRRVATPKKMRMVNDENKQKDGAVSKIAVLRKKISAVTPRKDTPRPGIYRHALGSLGSCDSVFRKSTEVTGRLGLSPAVRKVGAARSPATTLKSTNKQTLMPPPSATTLKRK